MPRHPLVSILMGAFNREAWIGQTLKSIFRQSEENFELIIVNDGSTDGTQDILSSVKDPRIKTIRWRQNRGFARARQEGLRHARGKWITFFDSDDVMLPDSLRLRLQAVRKKGGYRAVFGKIRRVLAENKNPWLKRLGEWFVKSYDFPRRLGEIPIGICRYFVIPCVVQTPLFHHSVVKRVGGFRTVRHPKNYLQHIVDLEFTAKINQWTPILFVDAPVMDYRWHGENMSAGVWRKILPLLLKGSLR